MGFRVHTYVFAPNFHPE